MLRPYTPPTASAMAMMGGGAGGGAGGAGGADGLLQGQLLVPTTMRTLEQAQLPMSLVPRPAVNLSGMVSSIPRDAFIAYTIAVRLPDGRSLRSLRRFSSIRALVDEVGGVCVTRDVTRWWQDVAS